MSSLGEWIEYADGTAHYVLAGRPLCRVASPVVGPAKSLPAGGSSVLYTVPQCERCVELNCDRWSRCGAARGGA